MSIVDTDSYHDLQSDKYRDPPMPDYTLTLDPPLRLTVETADKQHRAQVDVYEAWRFLTDAQKQPNEEKHWAAVKSYLAGVLNVDHTLLSEREARKFHEVVLALGTKAQDDLKKTSNSIVCSPPSTEQPYQPTTVLGPSGESELGPETSPTASLN